MMYAVRGDNVVIAKELLLSGADPTIRNKVRGDYLVHIRGFTLLSSCRMGRQPWSWQRSWGIRSWWKR